MSSTILRRSLLSTTTQSLAYRQYNNILPYTLYTIIRSFAVKTGDIRYTKSHEYVKLLSDNTVSIGISTHAQSELGDVVFVELPGVDQQISTGNRFASVESTKAASDVYAPIDIKVTKINEALNDDPALVNKDAEGDAWFIEAEISDKSQLDNLLDTDAYNKHVEQEKH